MAAVAEGPESAGTPEPEQVKHAQLRWSLARQNFACQNPAWQGLD